MRYEFAISLRYFRSRRSEGAMTFVGWVATGGVTLGVAALVVAMSVMNGYKANLTRAMSGALPHVTMHTLTPEQMPTPQALGTWLNGNLKPVSISPFVRHQALLRGPHSGKGSVRGVLVRGIEVAVESRVPDLLIFLRDGSPDWFSLPLKIRLKRSEQLMLSLATSRPDGAAPVLLSPRLARMLGISLGETITPLKFPEKDAGFSPIPLPGRMVLAGYFESGITSVDELFVIMGRGQAKRIFAGRVVDNRVGLRLQDPTLATEAAQALRQQVRDRHLDAYVFSWIEDNAGLFGLIRLQSWMLFLVLMFIVILALFGMVSGLVMMVAEKTREITILKSLGATSGAIYRIFMVQGLLIGMSGTLLGMAIGGLTCWALDTFPMFTIPPGVYPGSDRVPVRIDWREWLLVAGATFVACWIATYIPARKATAIHPAEGLRGE